MQSTLIVRNFGPIENVELDLRNVNVFIGPQSSGKSALAKIYTIFKAPRKFLNLNTKEVAETVLEKSITDEAFQSILEEYNIASFLRSNTEIRFISELHNLSYSEGRINYEPRLLSDIHRLEALRNSFDEHKEEIKKSIIAFGQKFIFFRFKVENIVSDKTIKRRTHLWGERLLEDFTEEKFDKILAVIKETEDDLSTNTALYIPAERNFINIIKKASLNLQLNNVPIPKHILLFGAEMEKARISELDLGFLHQGLVYRNIEGDDRIFTSSEHSIKLGEAASGIQSALPVMIPILSHKGKASHRSFVIEEPELNLFPSAQYELIKTLETSRVEPYWEDYGSIHTYTTHSPYILSALNNLLYADKVKSQLESRQQSIEEDEQPVDVDDLISGIVPATISPYYFTAYQISNGGATPIFDRVNGLIKENFIDESSDLINEDFEALMNLVS